jgi:AraC-like DNA-binding protein
MTIANGTFAPHDAPLRDEPADRPVVVLHSFSPPTDELDWHTHSRGQLMYSADGVAAVHTPQGAWMAPPACAIWTPAGMPHAVRMLDTAGMRVLLLIDPARWRTPDDRSRVIAVSPLLRALLEAAVLVPEQYDRTGRDGHFMELLVGEVERAEVLPLAVPFPTSPALAAKCRAFVERPSPHDTIDSWSTELQMGRRAFTRSFRRETGMSFAEWRRQACLLTAIPRLDAGDSVTRVASDLGYESPAAFATMFKRLVGVAPSRY